MSKHTPERYYVSGKSIWRSPVQTDNSDGSGSMTLGFKVCSVSEAVNVTELAAFFNRAEICKEACAGIPTSSLKPGAVKELVEALENLLGFGTGGKSMESCQAIDEAQARLANFKEED